MLEVDYFRNARDLRNRLTDELKRQSRLLKTPWDEPIEIEGRHSRPQGTPRRELVRIMLQQSRRNAIAKELDKRLTRLSRQLQKWEIDANRRVSDRLWELGIAAFSRSDVGDIIDGELRDECERIRSDAVETRQWLDHQIAFIKRAEGSKKNGNGGGRTKPKRMKTGKPPGRPPDTDPARDEKIHDAWKAAREKKPSLTYSQFAVNYHPTITGDEVKAAVDRHSKRRPSPSEKLAK